jgi:hypothetical protein
MSDARDHNAREFHVDTKFQKMARRAGGLSREEAINNAFANIDGTKPKFEYWLDEELALLLNAIPREGDDVRDNAWMNEADVHSRRLADVAATMGYEFISYVANNLSLMFDAIRRGADYRRDVMSCHIDALQLARKEKFRRMKPEDLPELTDGLRRVLESPKLKSRQNDSSRPKA